MSYVPPLEQPHPDNRKHLWDYKHPHRDPSTEPEPSRDFPRAVYRLSEAHRDHVDHPGVEAKTVVDQGALEAALEDGWSLTPPKIEVEE